MEADNNSPPFEGSKLYQKRPSKMDEYETNIENYEKNKEFAREMIDPRGIVANGIYVSFSGVIECAEVFTKPHRCSTFRKMTSKLSTKSNMGKNGTIRPLKCKYSL